MTGEGVEERSTARDLPFLSDDIGGLFSMSTPIGTLRRRGDGEVLEAVLPIR
jgi:hypothetical protein